MPTHPTLADRVFSLLVLLGLASADELDPAYGRPEGDPVGAVDERLAA